VTALARVLDRLRPLLAKPSPPELPAHTDLERLALCLDCGKTFDLERWRACPACASGTFTSVERFFTNERPVALPWKRPTLRVS